MITEGRIRQIIREELTEAAKHGYRVMDRSEMEWAGAAPRARRTHVSENPFVKGSPAYKRLFNDGVERIVVHKLRNAGTPYEEGYNLYPEVVIKEDSWVICPHLDPREETNTVFFTPGRVTRVITRDARELGVPGARPGDEIPLATVSFPGTGRALTDIGLAFLVRVGGPRSKEAPDEGAREAMARYRHGKSEHEERSERQAERERRRSEREQDEWEEPKRAPAPGMPHTPRPPIRRVGGVAGPLEKKPLSMSADDTRSMLGLRRR